MKKEDIIDFSKPEMAPIKGSVNFIAINKQPFNEVSIQSNSSSNPLGVYDLKTSLYSEGKGKLDEIPLPPTTIKFTSMNNKSESDGKQTIRLFIFYELIIDSLISHYWT